MRKTSPSAYSIHHENTPIQIYIKNFTTKNWKFKKTDIFHTSAIYVVNMFITTQKHANVV